VTDGGGRQTIAISPAKDGMPMDHLDELALLMFRLIAAVLNGTETSHKDYFRRIAAHPYQLMNRGKPAVLGGNVQEVALALP
jgi:hypothetical protein